MATSTTRSDADEHSQGGSEAVFLLVSRRLSRITGQILNIDGGLEGAFLS